MEIHIIKPKKNQEQKIRVVAYCRVSTESENQENSLENQMAHYSETIAMNPEYSFVKIYSDFGISGFKENRPGFQEMMQDARDGKFDLIIAKSISRFARNTVTVLKAIRELKERGIGVFFELQNINTLTTSGELLLTILSAFAQAESETYSELARMAVKRKYEKGETNQRLDWSFGYAKNEQGHYEIVKEEAEWIRKIYKLVSDGYSLAAVARYLNENGVKTVRGAEFTESTIVRIIENEIYKGDYLLHKHYVNADRKLVRNEGQVDSWYIQNDHPYIVHPRLWNKAQEALEKRRDYLREGSLVGENTTEVYPYKNQVFCGECGSPLYRRIYSNGNRVCFMCSGVKRKGKRFCSGVNVPDNVLREWMPITGNIYITKKKDDLGKSTFQYVKESSWKKTHKKTQAMPLRELNDENYPYRKLLYCGICGSRLVRYSTGIGEEKWICDGTKRKGVKFCKGVRVPDKVIRAWEIKEEVFIEGKETSNGEKCYTYTSKTGSNKR